VTKHVLTVAEVASMLKVSEKSIYRLAQRGQLPGFKVGGSWRFRPADLDAWITARVRSAKRRLTT
jgi:excisionase family DNA binding protein